MTISAATNAHEHAAKASPIPVIQARATAADATGIARAVVGAHEFLVEGGGNFDLAPSSAEILVGALAADLVDGLLLAGDRRGIGIEHARVEVLTYFNAGLIGGVATDDPIGPHDFTATCKIVAPKATETELVAIREEAEAASALVQLLRNATGWPSPPASHRLTKPACHATLLTGPTA